MSTPASRPLPETPRRLVVSPDTLRGGGAADARTPPGQTLTTKWPVLHFGPVAHVDPASWRLRVFGLCENPYELTYDEFRDLLESEGVDVRCDIHCVTHWSRLDNLFTGVPTRLLVDRARPTAEARFVMQHAASDPQPGFTVNVPLDEFVQDDCLLAAYHDGRPLSSEHGGPVRAVVPRLYFWKGAKWINGIEFRRADAPGFWEVNGYHMRGDPWQEQRFGW